MKLKSYIVLALTLCLLLFGCANTAKESNVSFYYCKSDADYGFNAAAITFETRKEHIDPLAYDALVEAYLKGPKSADMRSPFPEGTALIDLTAEQDACYVVLSNQLSELTGIELTIACVCLTRTVSEITGCAKVQISAHNSLLDNRPSITMGANELLLSDHSH